jgi:chemotaxis protein MotB
LGDNPDISDTIRGHTDDDAFTASGPIADNWDLSHQRASNSTIFSENKKSTNKILLAGKIPSPLGSNATAEGKLKIIESKSF